MTAARIATRIAAIAFGFCFIPIGSAAAATQLLFPHLAVGGSYTTTLLFSNRSRIATTATIEFVSQAGNPLNVTIAGRTADTHRFAVPALGSVKLAATGDSSAATTGWASLSTDPPAEIRGNIVFDYHNLAEASVADSPATSFADFVADEDGRYRTGFAIANPGSTPAMGTLTLRAADGGNPREYPVSRPPRTQEAKFIYEAFPGARSGRAEIRMTSGSVSVIAVRFDTLTGIFSTVSVGNRSVYVSGSCEDIQAAIDSLPPGGGQVIIEAGTYTCRQPIVVAGDNVDLRGQGTGTVITLEKNANCPVLVAGDLSTPPAIHRNIRISDLVIDGNRSAQSMECWGGPCDSGGLANIRNNGITLRGLEDSQVEDVTIHSARSGGLVTEKGCRRLSIRGVSASDSYYDGLAGYDTQDSTISGVQLKDNQAAGLSFDLNFSHNTISDCTISNSGSVGIFMRASHDNLFSGVRIRNSAQYGCFLAQVDSDPQSGATGNTFVGLIIADSKLAGFRVNDPSCINNSICASQFTGNLGGAVSEARQGLVQGCTNIVR